jgi:DNA-binding CsgD family transcriptional regulator
MEEPVRTGESASRERALILATLTDGQRDCLQLVARHQTSKEIARLLGISKDTVDQRISAAVKKLGANNRAEAARMLIELSLYDQVAYDLVDMAIMAETDISVASLEGAEPLGGHRSYALHSAASVPVSSGSPWIDALPLSTQKGRINTLSWQARLVWMLVIPLVIGFLGLQLIAVLDGLSRFYE